MAAVVHRTELVEDPELIAQLDAAVARHAPRWMRLSTPKVVERIDMWFARFDPAEPERLLHRGRKRSTTGRETKNTARQGDSGEGITH